MAELHIDTDWKKQAQEEKKRLAEEQAKRAAEAAEAAKAPPPPAPVPPGVAPVGPAAAAGVGQGAGGRAGVRGQRAMPEASFGTIVQSALTQAMFYLGELAAPGQPPTVNLDMAKHHLDTLRILEEKTVNNLTEEEQRLLDHALYDLRTRFVAVASQYL
jgi:hypothetical protein